MLYLTHILILLLGLVTGFVSYHYYNLWNLKKKYTLTEQERAIIEKRLDESKEAYKKLSKRAQAMRRFMG